MWYFDQGELLHESECNIWLGIGGSQSVHLQGTVEEL